MRTEGIRIVDRGVETRRIQWLVVSQKDCSDEVAEHRLALSHFLLPHARWNWPPAFVDPVVVRRTRRRVLLSQRAGVDP